MQSSSLGGGELGALQRAVNIKRAPLILFLDLTLLNKQDILKASEHQSGDYRKRPG